MRSDSSQTVLVTGATGFIGLNLVHALAAVGHHVVGVANGPIPEAATTSLLHIEAAPIFEQIDIRDGSAVGDVVARHRPDVVIHAAAVTAGVDRERSQARTIVDVNVGGTQSVLDACSKSDVSRFVYVSSGAVYGAATFGTETLDETTPVHPVGLYGITKCGAEQLVRRHGELHEVAVVIGRLSAVFGPWEYATGARDFMSPMLQLVRDGRNGETCRYVEDAPRNWVYGPEAARALVGLAVGPAPRFDCYNVCPGERGSIAQLIDRLRRFAPRAEFLAVEGPEDATVSYDADPRLRRAEVSGVRIRAELGGDLWSEHEDAFDAYLSWIESNSAWL